MFDSYSWFFPFSGIHFNLPPIEIQVVLFKHCFNKKLTLVKSRIYIFTKKSA